MAFSRLVSDAVPYRSSKPEILRSGLAESYVIQNAEQLSSRQECPAWGSAPCYDMSGEKILIIFNHFKYKKTRHYREVPKTRFSTHNDVRSLENTFRQLGFIVVTHHDWEYKDIIQYLTQVCSNDHRHTSCFAVTVMTHGEASHLCASDRKYPLSEITHIVKTAASLDGKPKLFFFQSPPQYPNHLHTIIGYDACRPGHMSPKSQQDEESISVDVDCLLLYSCYEDYVSYRNLDTGSWMVQALCRVLDTHHSSLDLTGMVTLINNAVAAKSTENGQKQVPVSQIKLTKFLIL